MSGWDQAHKGGTYRWRETPQDPAGAMWHHTATTQYTPNRDKASAYAGLSRDGSDRLYQAGAGVPVYTLANAHPAPISSGAGVRTVLENYVKKDVPFVGRQTASDDSPTWYGNTHYWNTEVVLDGTGSPMDPGVWDMLITVGAVLNDVFGWTSARHIGHGQHTRRKIDLWNGTYKDMAATIDAYRIAVDEQGDDMATVFKIGNKYPSYEEVTWLLFEAAGGTINVNKTAGDQLDPVLGKTDPTLVTDTDFEYLGGLLNMSDFQYGKLVDNGLFSLGKEVAALRSLVYND